MTPRYNGRNSFTTFASGYTYVIASSFKALICQQFQTPLNTWLCGNTSSTNSSSDINIIYYNLLGFFSMLCQPKPTFFDKSDNDCQEPMAPAIVEKSIIIDFSHKILLSVSVYIPYNQFIIIDFYEKLWLSILSIEHTGPPREQGKGTLHDLSSQQAPRDVVADVNTSALIYN